MDRNSYDPFTISNFKADVSSNVLIGSPSSTRIIILDLGIKCPDLLLVSVSVGVNLSSIWAYHDEFSLQLDVNSTKKVDSNTYSALRKTSELQKKIGMLLPY